MALEPLHHDAGGVEIPLLVLLRITWRI